MSVATVATTGFVYPEHLNADGIDQIMDLAARSYLAVDSEGGAIIVEPRDGSSIVLRMLASMEDLGDLSRAVIVCRPEHTLFWEECVARTSLTSVIYHGPRRHAKLADAWRADVLITTSDTLQNDLLTKEQIPGKRCAGSWQRGEHFDAIATVGTLWVFADIKPLQSRSSETHRFWAKALDLMESPQVVALQRDMPPGEGLYDLGRLVVPQRMPSVGEFEQRYGHSRRKIPNRIDGVDQLFGPTLIRAAPTREDF